MTTLVCYHEVDYQLMVEVMHVCATDHQCQRSVFSAPMTLKNHVM